MWFLCKLRCIAPRNERKSMKVINPKHSNKTLDLKIKKIIVETSIFIV